ncbi:hypothetical protein ES705_27288 [subsurface metagenome]
MAEEEKFKKEKFKFYLVEGKGYREQFSSEIQARREYGRIKKAGKTDEVSFFVKLYGKNELVEDWILMDEVTIKEAYYE